MPNYHRALAVFAILGCTTPALAQGDVMAMAHTMAANQLGVLQYCRAQGYVDADAVEAERSVISSLPASTTATDAAESLGKQGTISANGTNVTLASMASSHNTTVSALCKQMGSATIQAAAMYKQNGMGAGGMTGMPTMPGGMPSMGTMPTMPSMGSMPAMPGVPPVR